MEFCGHNNLCLQLVDSKNGRNFVCLWPLFSRFFIDCSIMLDFRRFNKRLQEIKMKNLIVLLLAITVTDLAWFDGADPKKSVLVIYYSDGTNDKLAVDKKQIKDPKVVEQADKIIRQHTGE